MRFRFLMLPLISAFSVTALAQSQPQPSTQLPSLPVGGHAVPGENKIIGTYGQPEWSARRPFPGVSVYVQPAGQAELELGYRDARDGRNRHEREWSAEIEVGLPHRLQLALEEDYANFREGARPLRWHQSGVRTALRYALADWGKIPLNPALGLGRRFNPNAPDAALYELAIGDELTPRWHWGANASYERQLGRPRLREFATSAALTYSVTNETLNVGLQGEWKRSYEVGDTPSLVRRPGFGPCVQYRPIDRLHFDLVALFGTERGRAVHGLQLTFGFEFGEGSDDHDDDERRPGGRFGH